MKIGRSVFLFIIISLLHSCADKPTTLNSYFGVRIENSLPSGTIYKDTAGAVTGFRSILVDITNDTIVPANFQISFPGQSIDLKPVRKEGGNTFFRSDSSSKITCNKYKIFILPDSMTDAKLYEENSLPSKELKLLLDKGLCTHSTLKSIAPGETYRLRLGFLFERDGLARAELFSKGHPPKFSAPVKGIDLLEPGEKELGLLLGVTLYSDYSIIPCGKLFYSTDLR